MLSLTVVEGRLVRDPELRYTPSGIPVVQFTLACDRDYTGADGKRETDFYACVAWRKQAETIANTLTKGRLMSAVGRFESRTYTTEEGQQRRVWELKVDRFNYLDKRPEGQATHNADYEGDMGREVTDDLPFSDGCDA